MAIKVGVTSLRVMMATVVVVLPLGLTLGLVLLKRLGLMTGVKVLCFVALLLEAETGAEEDEAKVKSSSRSSKSFDASKEGVVVADADTLVGSISPDWISGVELGCTRIPDVWVGV